MYLFKDASKNSRKSAALHDLEVDRELAEERRRTMKLRLEREKIQANDEDYSKIYY